MCSFSQWKYDKVNLLVFGLPIWLLWWIFFLCRTNKCRQCRLAGNPLIYNGPDSSDGQLLGSDFVKSKVSSFTPILSDPTLWLICWSVQIFPQICCAKCKICERDTLHKKNFGQIMVQTWIRILIVKHAKCCDCNLFSSSACLGNMQNIEKIYVGFQNFCPGEPKNRHLGYNILNNKMHNMFLNIFDKAYRSNSFGQCRKDQCEGESIWRWKNFERNSKWFFWVMKRWELIERWQLKSFLTSWDGRRTRVASLYMWPRFLKILLFIWPLKSGKLDQLGKFYELFQIALWNQDGLKLKQFSDKLEWKMFLASFAYSVFP